MPAVIANQFGEASGTFRAALIGLAVMLFVITIIVNLIASTVVAALDREVAGRSDVSTTLERPAGWRRRLARRRSSARAARGGAPRTPSPACSWSLCFVLALVPLVFVLVDVLSKGLVGDRASTSSPRTSRRRPAASGRASARPSSARS